VLCPICNLEEAEKHPTLGILPGLACKARRDTQKRPDFPVEFTTEDIKIGRREYSKDILQPFRGNEASKEFALAYPEKAKKMFSQKELKGIKNVWK
jgi:hypothetical protein